MAGFSGKALGQAGGPEGQLALRDSSRGHGSGHFASPGPSSPPQSDGREFRTPQRLLVHVEQILFHGRTPPSKFCIPILGQEVFCELGAVIHIQDPVMFCFDFQRLMVFRELSPRRVRIEHSARTVEYLGGPSGTGEFGFLDPFICH